MGDFENFINGTEANPPTGGFADFMRQSEKPERRRKSRAGQITGAEIDSLLNGEHGQKIRNFFGAVKQFEGGQPNLIVGGKMTFDPNGDHPNRVGLTTAQGSSTAAGDYQITGSNWYKNGLKRRLGAKNFNPENQLRGAVMMFADRENRKGLNALLNDDYDTAEKVAALDWAALPSSQLHPKAFNQKKYNEFLKLAGSNNAVNAIQANSYLPSPANVPRVEIETGEPLADVYPTADGKRPLNAPPPITADWTAFPQEKPTNAAQSVPNTFSSFLSEQEQTDLNNLGTAQVGETSFGAEYPKPTVNTAEKLPSDYLEYLKVRELPDSQEARNDYSQVLQESVNKNGNLPTAESYQQQRAAYDRRQAEAQATDQRNQQDYQRKLADYNAKYNQPNNAVLTQDAPNVLKAGTYDNIRESENSGNRISLDLRNVEGDKNDYINRETAKQIAAKYNVPEADALEVLNRYPLMHDGVAYTPEEIAAKQSANFSIKKDLIEEIRRKSETRVADSDIPLELEDDFQNFVRAGVYNDTYEDRAKFLRSLNEKNATAAQEKEAELRQRAIDELDREYMDAGKFVRNENGRLKYGADGSLTLAAPTEEEISERIRSIKNSQLDAGSANAARSDAAALNDTLGTKPAALVGGAAGGVAGINRSVAGLFRSVGFDGGYNLFSKIAQKAQILSDNTGDDGTATQILKIAGSSPFDVARIIGMTRTGGMVVGFAADHALQAQGAGKEKREVGRETEKGALLGGVFSVAAPIAGKVADTFGKGAISFVDAFPSRAAYKAANIGKTLVREGTEIAVIGHGTYQVSKAFGATDEQASAEMLGNVIFHVANKAGTKAFDKIYKVWKDGRASDAYVDPNGKVKLLNGEVAPEYVDAEIITDPKSNAYRASENAKRIGQGKEDFDANSPGNVPNNDVNIYNRTPAERLNGSQDAPRSLAAENPRRIEVAQPEAVQKVAVDTRAQKVLENIKDGKTYTAEQLQKATRINAKNLDETLMNLYAAKAIEINSDNSFRFIGGENTAAASKSLFERAGEVQAPKENIALPKSSVESEIGRFDSDVTQPEQIANNTTPEPSKADDLSIYEALPQQKRQETQTEKPKAKLDYAEPENIAEKLNIFTERGRKASIQPKVVEQSDLLTSMDEGYPQEFQPRDRSRAASKAQVSEIANRLNPEFLGDSPKASDGRPLVVPVTMPDGKTKYAVISGNGRTAGIREAYNLDNEGAKSYKDFANSKGGNNLNQPVYVGVMSPNEIDDFSEFAKEANESATAQMSASEQAKSDADRLDSSVLNLFVPSDDGSIHGAANRDFVRAFLDKTTSTSERNRYIDSEGKLNQEGVTKVKNAIFAKAFGNSELGMATLARMSESTDSNIKNITNALLAKAGELSSFAEAAKDNRRFKDADIAPDFARAMEKYSELKESNTSLDEYIRQGALFGADTSPLQTRVMQVFDFYKRRSKSIRGIIDNYIKAAEALGDPNQISLFGQNEIPSKEAIFAAAVKDYEKYDTGEETQISLLDPDQGRTGQSNARQKSDDVASETTTGQSAGLGQNQLDKPQFAVAGDNVALQNTKEKIFALGIKKLSQNAPSKDILIAKAKFENKNGAVLLNPEATEYIRQAVGEMFEDHQPVFLGAYLKPEHIEMFKQYLDDGLRGLRPFAASKAKSLLQTIIDSADANHNDAIILSSSPEFPDGLPQARQEEFAHRADARTRGDIDPTLILDNPAARKAADYLKNNLYDDVSDASLAQEVIAKAFRTDAESELNLTADEIQSITDDYMFMMLGAGVNSDSIANSFENISESGKEFAENVRQKEQTNFGTDGRGRAREIDAFNGRSDEVRQRGQSQSARTFEADTNRFARLRQTEDFGANRSGTQSLAVRLKNEILFDRASDVDFDVEEVTADTEKSVKTLISYIYDGKRDVSPTEAAMNIIRTGYLAGLSVIKNNVLGNSSNIVVEQLAKPLMATADMLNPKAKTRTTPGLAARDIIEGFFGKDGFFRAGFIGEKGFITALAKGVDNQEASRTDMNISDKQTNFVRNTGVPLIDLTIEATKRLVTGIDRPFKAYARSSEKSGLARLEASKEKLAGAQWKMRVNRLKDEPTAYINDVAERYAETVTFQNPNAVTQTYDKFRRFLIDEKAQARIIPTETQRKIAKYVGSAAYLATGQVAPFMSTPSNVGFRTLEYFFPTGIPIAAAKFFRIGQSFERQNFMEEEALRRAKIVKRVAGVRALQDRKFNEETNAKKKRLDEQKRIKNEAFKREIESIKNSKVFTDAAKKARIEQLKASRDKWLEAWQANREKYLQTRTGLADKAAAQRKVVDEIQKKDWQSEDAYADLKFSAFENRAFAEAAGRAGFGATVGSLALLGVIYGLIKAVGTTDYDDEKEKAQEKRAGGIPNDSVSIFGYRFPYSDNPFGNALKMGINLFEQYERPGSGYDRAAAMTKRFGKDLTSLNPLTEQGFTKKDWASYAGSKANSMTPLLNLKILQEIGEIADDKPRKYWEEGFAAQYLIKIPKLREYLPESESFIGGEAERGDVWRRGLRAVNPLQTTKPNIDQSDLPNTPVTKIEKNDPSKDKKLDDKVRSGKMPVEDAENSLTNDLTNGDISEKQYKERVKNLSLSKPVQRLSDTDANKEQDFADIEKILKNADEADKPELQQILLEKAKKKLNSKTSKGIDEGERLLEIYDRHFQE